MTARLSPANIRTRLRRPKKTPHSIARLAAAPAAPQGAVERFTSALVVVVPITTVAVVDCPAASVTLPGLTVQDAFEGAPEQDRLTAPLKLAFAAMLSVTTPFAPLPMESVAGAPVSENAGVSALIVTAAGKEVTGLKFVSPE